MPATLISDYEDYRKLGALCGSKGGYFCYCRWTNNSDMSVAYGSNESVESNYTQIITASEMNGLKPSIDNKPGVGYISWIGSSAEGTLDIDI